MQFACSISYYSNSLELCIFNILLFIIIQIQIKIIWVVRARSNREGVVIIFGFSLVCAFLGLEAAKTPVKLNVNTTTLNPGKLHASSRGKTEGMSHILLDWVVRARSNREGVVIIFGFSLVCAFLGLEAAKTPVKLNVNTTT
eukprot:TRINITY_DN13_c0_g1_i9.p5 TRINITY_DN13_c0_g1~~TRINITY_DN13_c0_g1_i9.p5  ORF type:complete len:142 (+),score=9.48 TRINITY_DN13_c0_g1_i9:743-1168(+)